MATFAVVKVGGKQYLVKDNDEIVVDRVTAEEKKTVELVTLATFSEDGSKVELGKPTLATSVKAEVLSHLKGEKVRIARFKSKVRRRTVRGFRSQLTRLKVSVTK